MTRFYLFICALCYCAIVSAQSSPGISIVESARKQINITLKYDPKYVQLAYPNGDVPKDRGVCTDVVIRALRDARAMDLQQLVHEDMSANFSIYPRQWGLMKPDKNIDHRRVPNLQTFLKRHARYFKPTKTPSAFQPGDIVTSLLPGNLPHTMIISDKMSANEIPLVIHNIGAGTQEEDALFNYPLTGHYRLNDSN